MNVIEQLFGYGAGQSNQALSASQFAMGNAQNMLNAYRPPVVEMTPWDLGMEASDAPYAFWLGANA